ncbi:hypothetical protein ACFX15_018629 [Malus domestica]
MTLHHPTDGVSSPSLLVQSNHSTNLTHSHRQDGLCFSQDRRRNRQIPKNVALFLYRQPPHAVFRHHHQPLRALRLHMLPERPPNIPSSPPHPEEHLPLRVRDIQKLSSTLR